jgi:hypothetical protein
VLLPADDAVALALGREDRADVLLGQRVVLAGLLQRARERGDAPHLPVAGVHDAVGAAALAPQIPVGAAGRAFTQTRAGEFLGVTGGVAGREVRVVVFDHGLLDVSGQEVAKFWVLL